MTDDMDRFAGYVATLGRGPGRSRALTRQEARDAMTLLLQGAAHPMQVGAFLMLLRYRGEDPEEITGLVEGVRAAVAAPVLHADLDWPSYGAGRTRGAPWFLLAALALAQAGTRVFMHGTNAFSGGTSVEQALAALGLTPVMTVAQAAIAIGKNRFAYMPARALSPRLAELLGLRRLLGLRSPINTVARLINPAGAPASVDGVFHPPYIETHLAVAERLQQLRLLVLKGGGGEAERNPAKPTTAHVWSIDAGRRELLLPALTVALPPVQEPDIDAIWTGRSRDDHVEARIIGTIALGLAACHAGGDAEARVIWQDRLPTYFSD